MKGVEGGVWSIRIMLFAPVFVGLPLSCSKCSDCRFYLIFFDKRGGFFGVIWLFIGPPNMFALKGGGG